MDTFIVLPRVHLIHTIFLFETLEVRSPILQTVCKSELKQRSYGRLKTTASICAKISQLRNQLRNQPFVAKISQLQNHLQAHVCHFASCNSIFTAVNHVAKSPPSCEITLQIISKLRNHKFNLQNQSSNFQNGQFKRAKFSQVMFQFAKSICVNSDICNRLS